MTSRALSIQHWTGTGPVPRLMGDLLVFTVDTPHTPIRETARQLVRHALRETLAPRLGCCAADVPLISLPGQPLRLAAPGRSIGLSVSHEPGLSLVAIRPDGPVGVDLMRREQLALANEELIRLTIDYLGEEKARHIADLPDELRWPAFAMAWAGFEAKRKSLGAGIAEWSAERQASLDRCTVWELALPKGFCGAVAIAR